LAWESGIQTGSGATDIVFSANPFDADGLTASVAIYVGTAVFNWDGRADDGNLVSTGDYLVQAHLVQAGIQKTYSRVLTVLIKAQGILSNLNIGPSPATDILMIDLSQMPNGIEVDIQIWNLAGELIRYFHADSSSQPRITWNLEASNGQALSNGIYVLMARSLNPDPRLQDKRLIKFAISKR
jgi:flagellar hook assembly protein FlgD